jgi:hypothetical protein
MIPWAIDDLILSDDNSWQSALKDVHGLPQLSAQLAERFGRWPTFGGLTRPGRRLSLVTLWGHATPALRAAAKRQFEQYASPEREVIRRLSVVNCVVPGVSPSSVLLALGPWNVARSGSTYAPRNLTASTTIGTVAGGVIWRPGRSGQAIQIAVATTNLFADPSAEYSDMTYWSSSGGGGSTAKSTSQYYYGFQSILVTSPATYKYIYQALAVTAVSYTLSARVRRSDGGIVTTGVVGAAGTIFTMFDSSGVAFDSVTSLGDGWYLAIKAGTATAGTRNFGVGVSGTTYAFYFDGLQLEQTAFVTPYCDGSLGPGHAWSGAAHASASSRTIASCKFVNPISTATGSLCLWWKPIADNTGPTEYLFSEGNLWACFNSADDKIYLSDGTNTITTAALTFGAETWMHLVFTWSSAGLAVYRNGANAATGATYTAPTAGSFLFLGSNSSGTASANGRLDTVLVLGVALTAAQAATLYTAQAADWKARWCNVIAEEVKAFAIAGEETDQGVVSTLAVDGDVRWRSRDGARFWRVIAATGSFVVNNDGDDDAYPILYITPKTAKTGNTWAYKRWIPVKWLPTVAATSYPVDICNAGFDTATLTTAKMQADGDDLRVWVDGVEVNRWLDAMDSANTKVWVNLNFQASQTATMAVIGNTDGTTLTATSDITNWPSTGILYIDTEAITYTGKSSADKTFTGCTRGAKGTTAATHLVGATAYWIQHDVWILYGNSGASAPTVDDNYKPAFELDHSTNTSWVYEVFGENDGLRPASWTFEYTEVATKYTANHATNADPWSEIGFTTQYSHSGAGRLARWSLLNPCFITNANFTNGEYYRTSTTDPLLRIQSYIGGSWVNEASINTPTADAWTAWTQNEAIGASATKVGVMADYSGGCGVADSLSAEAADVTLTLNSSYTPVIVIGAEQSNYDLAVTLTNSTTGDSIVVALTMQLAQTLAIDSDAKTITLLADNSPQMQALTLTGGVRRDWLRLAAGNNTLSWSDTGTVSVEVEVLFDRRYFE